MAEDSTRQGNLETTCRGLLPTTGHNGCLMMMMMMIAMQQGQPCFLTMLPTLFAYFQCNEVQYNIKNNYIVEIVIIICPMSLENVHRC